MAMQAGRKNKTEDIQDILKRFYVDRSGKTNDDAVSAGLWFIETYFLWDQLSSSIESKEDSMLFDLTVCQIFNGEGHSITDKAQMVFSNVKETATMVKFLFRISLGEISQNPFVAEHLARLSGSVFQDCMHEIGMRHGDGHVKTASEHARWSILSAIAGIVSGADKAIQMNLTLKSALSNENIHRGLNH